MMGRDARAIVGLVVLAGVLGIGCGDPQLYTTDELFEHSRGHVPCERPDIVRLTQAAGGPWWVECRDGTRHECSRDERGETTCRPPSESGPRAMWMWEAETSGSP